MAKLQTNTTSHFERVRGLGKEIAEMRGAKVPAVSENAMAVLKRRYLV
ncbi:MAG: hypothetical protein IH955_11800, partial [Chloroflexi bacterium]|nr:hypothetical protein [Chloroflexota bacterium]